MLASTSDQQHAPSLAAFLALLVIAATAFGVLVATVGVLQQSEQESPEISVTNTKVSVNDPDVRSVGVSDEIGDRGDPIGYDLRLTLSVEAESPAETLKSLRIEFENSGGRGVLRHVSDVVESGELEPDGTVDDVPVARDVYFVRPTADENSEETYEIVIPTGVFVDHTGALRNAPTDESRVTPPGRKYTDPDTAIDAIAALGTGEGFDNTSLGLLETGDETTVTLRSDGTVLATVTIQLTSLSEHAGGTATVTAS